MSKTKAKMERTFLLIKPDGIERNLIGKIITRFEDRGFKLVAMKFMKATKEMACEHYSEHKEQDYFTSLTNYLAERPVVAMVWEGLGVIKLARDILGATDPQDSKPGTIRGDYCVDIARNLLHGSDDSTSAEMEIKIWFKDPKDLVTYTPKLTSEVVTD